MPTIFAHAERNPKRIDAKTFHSFYCSMPEVPYKYFMTVSPLDGKLYISDYQSKRILRVKTMGAVRDLTENMEVIAGTGGQCIPGDKRRCGDDGPAVQADLFYPKGPCFLCQ